jgi:hypothetical protein
MLPPDCRSRVPLRPALSSRRSGWRNFFRPCSPPRPTSLSASFLCLYFTSAERTTLVSSSFCRSFALRDAAPQADHRVARRPVNQHRRPLLWPVTNGSPPPELPRAPPRAPLPLVSVRPGRHLPELGTGAVLLSDPQAKLLDDLRHPAPSAYSRLSAPSWMLSPGESPTASNRVSTQPASSPTRPLHRSRHRSPESTGAAATRAPW